LKKKIIRIKNKFVEKISNIDNTLIGFLENFDRLIHLFLAVLIIVYTEKLEKTPKEGKDGS
jgi:hypothetical protein